MMRYHGLRGNILANREMVEEQLEVLVEANDQLVEKVVCLHSDHLMIDDKFFN